MGLGVISTLKNNAPVKFHAPEKLAGLLCCGRLREFVNFLLLSVKADVCRD